MPDADLSNTNDVLTLYERTQKIRVTEHDATKGKGNHYAKGEQKSTHGRNNHKCLNNLNSSTANKIFLILNSNYF